MTASGFAEDKPAPAHAAAGGYRLVADIGGTNTRVALSRGKTLLPGSIERFRNASFPSLEAVLRGYLETAGRSRGELAGACVAVAGPVRDGVGSMTNLDWTIDQSALARAAGSENVAIVNDLQAQSYSLDYLPPESTPRVCPAAGETGAACPGPRLVIGVGTGFNAAPVHETRAGRLAAASECGHMSLPVRSEEEMTLLRSLEAAHGFAAVEDVLSGRGLERVYAWAAARAGSDRRPAAAEIMAGLETGSDPIAEETVAVFIRFLGRVAGDLALVHLPYGGLYLVGGVARAMAPHFDRFGFGEAFSDKGRFSAFVRNFPVSLIADDYAALIGCAAVLDDRD